MALSATELSILITARDEASAVMKHIEDSSTSLNGALGKITENALGFAGGIAAIAGIGSVMDALGGVVVGFNSKLEQSTISWKTFTGSADAAAAVLTQVQQIAATTPFTFQDVDQAAKRFVNVGFSAQQALDFIKPLSNAVSSVGLGAEGVDRVSLALAQMTSKTKVQGDEMLQLTEAQIPAWDILAQATGKPIPELQKLVTEGRISAKEFTDAFASFYGDTGKFADAAHDQSLTLQGSLSTIKDELNIVGSTAFQPLFKALSDGARVLAAFVQSDQFTVWGARIQAVVGLVVDGLGGLAGAFTDTLGGVLNIVNTVGQAIYQGLQWLNPFATHSPALVSQVTDGVAKINSEYESLSGLTTTFAGLGTAFEDLSGKTSAFSDSVDGLSIKTEKALAVMGPGVTAAFNEASDAVEMAKVSLGDIKEAWDSASDALAPLKDNLGATKDALQAQQDTLSDLKLSLSDAKAAFDPLNDALKDAKQNATDAESAIKSLTSVPVAGTADFDKKISDANIALKQQALELSNVKNSSGYQALGDQIDAATAKLKEMQRQQATFIPNLPTGASAAQQKAHAEAVENNRVLADQARQAIAQQQAGIDALKAKQADLVAPAQKQLDLDHNKLDTINLQKEAVIGVANEQIKQSALAAQGIKEQTQAQIQAGIAAAGAAKSAADVQVDKLTPQVKAQQAVVDGLTARILDQQHAVDAAQKATDAANKTYSDAKEKVDDLGTAYRDTKQQVAAYEQQLKSTITTGDIQVQKIKAAAEAAKKAAKDAGTGPAAAKPDVLAGLDIAGSQAKIKAFSDQVASTRAAVTGNLDALGSKWSAIWSTVKSVLDRVLASFGGFQAIQPAIDFLQRFAGVAAALGAALVVASPLVGFFVAALAPVGALVLAVLSPIGLLVVGIAALAAAWTLNIGNIQQSASGLATAFEPLQALPSIVDKALSGDVLGALSDFVNAVGDVRARLIETVADWAGAFLNWAIPLLPALLGQVEKIGTALTTWVIGYGTKLVANVLRWGDAFVGWVLPRIPLILNTLETLGSSLFGWIRTQVPRLIDAVGQWATAFVQWVIPLLPQLLVSLEQIANSIIKWIRDGVPELLGAFVDWAGAFIDWIAPLIPPLLGELATLLGEIIRWAVEEGLPAIVGAIGDWGKAFVGWVAPRIVPMLAELAAIAVALIGWVKDRLPGIIAEVEKWGASFVDWIGTTVLPTLGPALDTIINGGSGFVGIVPWITAKAKDFPEAFGYWVVKFVLWVDDAKTQLLKKLDDIPLAIAEWVKGDGSTNIGLAAQPLGSALLQGIVTGITQGIPDFENAVNKAIWDSLGKVKDGALKAFSESTTSQATASAASSAAAAPVSNIPVSSDTLTNPLKLGAQNGPGTIPQIVGGFLTQAGMTPDQIAAFCGPLAAEAIAQGLGKGVDIPTLVKTALNAGWTAAAGQGGFISFQRMLDALGVPTVLTNMQGAIDDLAKGIPVAISTPLHYFLATGLDAAGKLIVGESGKVFRGGAAELTLQQIANLGGAIQAFITPAFQNGGDAITAFGDQLGGVGLPVSQLQQTVAGLGGDFDTVANAATSAADQLSQQFGISLDAASKIIEDHGAVANQVLGDSVPGSFAVSQDAVKSFANAFGVSLGQARSILTAGGTTADLVLGKTIPDAVKTTVDAIGKAGAPALWDLIRKNATDTGRDLSKYLKDIGAPAIDKATASLTDLVRASGLSLPQVQAQAGAAGRDVRTWLLTVGVPAADALRDSLGPGGVAGAATDLQKPVGDANDAVQSLAKDGFDVAKGATNDAKDAATQISAVLQGLADKMPALVQGIKDFISQLNQIPRDIQVNITTNQSGGGASGASSSGSGGGSSSSSNSGGSGPGGVNDQARQDAANAAERAAAAQSAGNAAVRNISGSSPPISQSAGDASFQASLNAIKQLTGGRAAGGPVHAGRSYLVGELGPELITPGHSGTVHTATATAGIAQALSSQWPGKWGMDPAMLATVTRAVQALGRALSAIPHSIPIALATSTTGVGDLQRVTAQIDGLPASLDIPVSVDTGQSMATVQHLRDTFRAVPRSVHSMLSVDAASGLRTVNQVATAMRGVPSSKQVAVHIQTLGGQQLQSLSANRAPTVQTGSGTLAVSAIQQHVARPATGSTAVATSTTGHISRDSARMIAEELGKVLQQHPPRVALEEVRSGLIRIGGRNGGQAGMA